MVIDFSQKDLYNPHLGLIFFMAIAEAPRVSETGNEDHRLAFDSVARRLPITTEFYASNVLERRISGKEVENASDLQRVLMNPGLAFCADNLRFKNRQDYESIHRILKTDTQAVFDTYWDLHNQGYLDRLDGLVSQGDLTQVVKAATRAVVVIPAMDETMLPTAIEALRDSYGDGFEDDISVIVYHNFKKEPKRDVLAAVTEVSVLRNVTVIKEKVSENNTVSMAKKVASDIALRLMTPGRRVPLVMMDADVVQLSCEMIQNGILKLGEEATLVVSPDYDFDPLVKGKFPVLGFILDIEKRIRDDVLSKRKRGAVATRNLIGAFHIINPSTLAVVGGFVPVFPEDIELSTQLKWLSMANEFPEFDPVAGIGQGAVVYLDASQEIENLRNGKSTHDHWLQKRTGRDNGSNGFHEDNWGMFNTRENPPELEALTNENLLNALNRFWEMQLAELKASSAYLSFASNTILHYLSSYGITVEVALGTRVEQMDFLTQDDVLPEGSVMIRRFTSLQLPS